MTRLKLAARLLAATALTLSFNATADLDEARRLAEAGNAKGALATVERHLDGHPDDLAARFLRARLLAENGRHEAAENGYRELALELPGHPEPHNNLAALYAARGEVERARQALLAALATHPSYAAAFDNLQQLHAHLASIAYRRALGNGETDKDAPLRLAALPTIHDLPRPTPTLVAAAEPVPTPIPSEPAPAQPAEPPVAQPTAPPAAEPATKPTIDPARAIIDAVKGWAAAWSAKDVKGYLAHYADDYRTDRLDHRRWAAQRKQRLTKPRTIRVTLKNLRVRVTGDDTAQAIFEQRYRADTYRDRVRKQLTLKRGADGWKIVAEKTLKVLG